MTHVIIDISPSMYDPPKEVPLKFTKIHDPKCGKAPSSYPGTDSLIVSPDSCPVKHPSLIAENNNTLITVRSHIDPFPEIDDDAHGKGVKCVTLEKNASSSYPVKKTSAPSVSEELTC